METNTLLGGMSSLSSSSIISTSTSTSNSLQQQQQQLVDIDKDNYNSSNDTDNERQKYNQSMTRKASNIITNIITNMKIRPFCIQQQMKRILHYCIVIVVLYILIKQLINYKTIISTKNFTSSSSSSLSDQWIYANDTELVQSISSLSSYKYLQEAIHAFDNITEKIMYPTTILQYYSKNNLSFTPNTTTKLIYFITPTIRTKTQIIDLIRLSQTLQHDQYIYWIVIEDRIYCSQRIRTILDRSNLLYAHTSILTPPYIEPSNYFITTPSRGVVQRNRGIEIVQLLTNTTYTITMTTNNIDNTTTYSNNINNTNSNTSTTTVITTSYMLPDGIVYFGDDDNGYDIQLFNEIRLLQKNRIGIFAVAYVGGGYYERCIVNEQTGLVQSIISNWYGPKKSYYRIVLEYLSIIPYVNNIRLFNMDMGGYVFCTSLLNIYTPKFSNNLPLTGFLETNFIQQFNISSVIELQPLVQNCTAIYVYHIKTSISTKTKHVSKDTIYYSLLELLY